MGRFIEGITQKCIVSGCNKEANHYDGILLKSRDAVSAGFCDNHWYITKCPNLFGIKYCYGIFDKSMGLITKKQKINETKANKH